MRLLLPGFENSTGFKVVMARDWRSGRRRAAATKPEGAGGREYRAALHLRDRRAKEQVGPFSLNGSRQALTDHL